MRLPPADVRPPTRAPRRSRRRPPWAPRRRRRPGGPRPCANASTPPPTAKPHTRARGEAVASAPPSPSRPDRGERDLELVAGAEEARAEHGVRAEQRAAHQHPSRAPGRPRAAPTATAAGSDQRPRPRARCGPSRARALRTRRRRSAPRPARRERAPPVSRSTLGSHIAASRTTRPGSRASRRASPAEPGKRDGPDQPEPDHRPAARAEVGEPVAQLREIRRARVAARLDRLARHVVGDRDAQTLEHGRRDVGGADDALGARRVRVQRGAPAEPGGARRDQPPGDVARVLDHQHEVAARDAPRAARASCPCPGGPGGSFATSTSVSRHSARAARATAPGARRARRARHDPTGRPRRPPPGCATSAGPA